MILKRETRSLLIMETRERGSLKEMERKMLQSRKRERKSHVNIVQRMAMMKTNVGNFILKETQKVQQQRETKNCCNCTTRFRISFER
jgi:hypothetical protein